MLFRQTKRTFFAVIKNDWHSYCFTYTDTHNLHLLCSGAQSGRQEFGSECGYSENCG